MTNTLIFWLLVAALLAAALAFLAPALWRRKRGGLGAGDTRTELNAEVYRSQIADLDRDLADGSLDPAHHAAAREELQRRLLADAAEAKQSRAPASAPRWATIGLIVAFPLAAVGLYAWFGSPASVQLEASKPVEGLLTGQAPNQAALPMRPSFEQLKEHLQREPNDARAWVMIARMFSDAEDWNSAAVAYERAFKASRKVAGDPGVLVEYADVLGMAQGGKLSGPPEEVIRQALLLNGRHPKALEMAGSLAYEKGQFKEAAAYWEDLLSQLDPASRMHAELKAAIDRARSMADSAPTR